MTQQTHTQPERLGTCRVCGYPVMSDEERIQDFFGNWQHAEHLNHKEDEKHGN